MKERDFLDLVIAKIDNISVAFRNDFVQNYMSDLYNSSKIMIDACVAIVKSDSHVLVELLIAHLEKQENKHLDVSTRYLLKSIDLTTCCRNDPDIHKRLFDELANVKCEQEDFHLLLTITKQVTSQGHFQDMGAAREYYQGSGESATNFLSDIIAIKENRGWSMLDLGYVDKLIWDSCTQILLSPLRKCNELVYKADKLEKGIICPFVSAQDESSYTDMLFVVEEAVYLMSAMKNRDFLNLTVNKIKSISVTRRDSFVREYLYDLGIASLHKIDACIALVQSDQHVLVELLIKHLIRSGNKSLDEASRHLLKNLDLATCFETKSEVREEIFGVLENLTYVSKEDSLLFLSMLKQLTSKKPSSSTMLPVLHLKVILTLV
ncbi:hypothetical protein ACHWQZ_G005766 [Mnemiopsis leidyi]